MSGPPTAPAPGRGPEEPDDGVIDLYVDGLRRSQLALSGVALVALFGLVGALPLTALVVPALDGATIGQVPLIALLPLLPFPAFVIVAILHERRASGLERAFDRLDALAGDPSGDGLAPGPRAPGAAAGTDGDGTGARVPGAPREP